jgi:hypothetical protein
MFNQSRIYAAAQRGSFNAAGRSGRFYGKSSKPKPPIADLRTFLAAVVAQVREDGKFLTKGDAEKAGGAYESTATNAVGRCRNGIESTERDFAGADKVLAFVPTLSTSNDFNAKLVQTVREAQVAGVVPFTAGIIAYSVGSYMKSVKRDTERQATQVKVEINVERISKLFEAAKAAKVRSPKITFGGDRPVQFYIAGAASKFRGSIMVTDGKPFGENKFYGHIEDGVFFPRPVCTPEIQQFIVDFAEDPAKVAQAGGRVTGSCVFCRASLTDAKGRSQAVSYGKKCASNFGLPWGEARIQADVTISSPVVDVEDPTTMKVTMDVSPSIEEVVEGIKMDRDASYDLEAEGSSVADAGEDVEGWDED